MDVRRDSTRVEYDCDSEDEAFLDSLRSDQGLSVSPDEFERLIDRLGRLLLPLRRILS